MLLHSGGKVRKPGWTVLDIAPGLHVDIVGDCSNLWMLPDASCEVVYASHVLEHLGYDVDVPRALREFHHVLVPNGDVLLSVPDLGILCRMWLAINLTSMSAG